MTDLRSPLLASDPGLVDVDALVRATRLRNVLRVNAALSVVSGAVAASAAGWLAGLLGVAPLAARIVGLGLIVVAIDVALASGGASPEAARAGSPDRNR